MRFHHKVLVASFATLFVAGISAASGPKCPPDDPKDYNAWKYCSDQKDKDSANSNKGFDCRQEKYNSQKQRAGAEKICKSYGIEVTKGDLSECYKQLTNCGRVKSSDAQDMDERDVADDDDTFCQDLEKKKRDASLKKTAEKLNDRVDSEFDKVQSAQDKLNDLQKSLQEKQQDIMKQISDAQQELQKAIDDARKKMVELQHDTQTQYVAKRQDMTRKKIQAQRVLSQRTKLINDAKIKARQLYGQCRKALLVAANSPYSPLNPAASRNTGEILDSVNRGGIAKSKCSKDYDYITSMNDIQNSLDSQLQSAQQDYQDALNDAATAAGEMEEIIRNSNSQQQELKNELNSAIEAAKMKMQNLYTQLQQVQAMAQQQIAQAQVNLQMAQQNWQMDRERLRAVEAACGDPQGAKQNQFGGVVALAQSLTAKTPTGSNANCDSKVDPDSDDTSKLSSATDLVQASLGYDDALLNSCPKDSGSTTTTTTSQQ